MNGTTVNRIFKGLAAAAILLVCLFGVCSSTVDTHYEVLPPLTALTVTADSTGPDATATATPKPPPATPAPVEFHKQNLPVVYITTEGGLGITSKEEYIPGTFSMDCSGTYMDGCRSVEGSPIEIRGRGQSSWENHDKKSYKLKFTYKTSLLGMAANKKWVLIDNHADKTLMQNYIATVMAGVLDNLRYTTHQYPVDVVLNGTYIGVYTLGEQVEVKTGRVDIAPAKDDTRLTFLIELGGRDDNAANPSKYYTVGYLRNYTIHYPKEEDITDAQANAIKDYLMRCDTAVKALQGYEELIDVDSLVDWVIAYELSFNLDGCMRRSCYMFMAPGGKLEMGPIWDFDLAFGNFHRYEYGLWATVGSAEDKAYVHLNWINCLAADEEFVNRLRERWQEVREPLRQRLIEEVDRMQTLITPSADLNFQVWNALTVRQFGQPHSSTKYTTYEANCDRLREYIDSRWQWLDEQNWNMPLTDF